MVVLGYGPYEALFLAKGLDPVGKQVRVGATRYTVVGVIDKRPSLGGFGPSPDDFAIVPYTAFRKQFGNERIPGGPFGAAPAMIAVVPREDVDREVAMREVEAIMRIRHDLTLDKPNDFDLVTQDAILKVWDQISRAVLLSLVVISSIALMVGGIGVMSIMTISVTERTREIGVRKAIGARRTEILFQFLIEAVVLTSLGGIIGITLGSAHRPPGQRLLGVPDLAAVVVVRPRPGVLGRRRHLLRHAAGLARVAARPDRSPALRVAAGPPPSRLDIGRRTHRLRLGDVAAPLPGRRGRNDRETPPQDRGGSGL